MPPIQVQMEFPYREGRVPTYANAVLANPLADGVLLDFGFLDPLLFHAIETEAKALQAEGKEGSLTLQVQPLERIAISRAVAEQLLQQLAQALGAQEVQSNE